MFYSVINKNNKPKCPKINLNSQISHPQSQANRLASTTSLALLRRWGQSKMSGADGETSPRLARWLLVLTNNLTTSLCGAAVGRLCARAALEASFPCSNNDKAFLFSQWVTDRQDRTCLRCPARVQTEPHVALLRLIKEIAVCKPPCINIWEQSLLLPKPKQL